MINQSYNTSVNQVFINGVKNIHIHTGFRHIKALMTLWNDRSKVSYNNSEIKNENSMDVCRYYYSI